VPNPIPQNQREVYRVVVPIITFFSNPLVTTLFVFFYSGYADQMKNWTDPGINRISNIPYVNIFIYALFGNSAFYYFNKIDTLTWFTLLLTVPSEWYLLHYVWVNRIEFEGVRQLLFIFQYMRGLNRFLHCFFNIYQTLEDFERERDNSGQNTNTRQHGVIPTLILLVGERVNQESNIAKMNLTQLRKYKEYLENELTKVTERLPQDLENSSGVTQSRERDLVSESCVICRDKPCEYRCIPCQHTCFCAECAHLCMKTVQEDDSEEGTFFTFQQEITPTSNVLMNDACPICRMFVQKLEYHRPIDNHVSRVPSESFHREGILRANREVFKLGKYLGDHPYLWERLEYCSQADF